MNSGKKVYSYTAYMLLFLFFCSGFSGLLYESIWTHYMKLLLGHSAYAQSLVLAIFMGGIALGAWLTSILIYKCKNALLMYALAEAFIGIFAFFFHDIFIFANGFLFDDLPTHVDSASALLLSKWFIAALLMLPQSILLGTTFPLMSSAFLGAVNCGRRHGKAFSLLYFNNSFGAAIGALASGFYFIQHYGLPGTLEIAGWINTAVAATVLLYIGISRRSASVPAIGMAVLGTSRFYYLMLACAFFTGVASFFYEIAWIRMLTLVLGATTHAFELMISAFILGLAFGSLWIKKRIDHLSSPIMTLGLVQFLMAFSALMTLVFYNQLFDFMAYLLGAVDETNQGYSLSILGSHVLALLVMLPATFFAGMTLPLITNVLFRHHNDERVFGHVYAVNTLGAIVGVVIAINLLPVVGTKGVVSLGAYVDVFVGIMLLSWLMLKKSPLRFAFFAITPLLLFQLIYQNAQFDPLKISSGVYRFGEFWSAGAVVEFHQDGKLSTVDIVRLADDTVVLANNGKPDAAINVYSDNPGTDEFTMILAGLLPLSLSPSIETVANIGMGSGQTVQALLTHASVKRVDTVEIEKAIIDGLPAFKIYSQSARFDKRSHIYIDDAKSFFSSRDNTYDLIVSEPSNPWVSGISSLFGLEFYKTIKKKLSDDGLLVQWLQLYEINLETLAPVFNALSSEFHDYAIYNTDDNNILVVASKSGHLKNVSAAVFSTAKAQELLRRIGISSVDDIALRYIGNKKILAPLFLAFTSEKTSDYYPKLEYSAARNLFLKDSAAGLTGLHHFPLPVLKILSNTMSDSLGELTSSPSIAMVSAAKNALNVYNKYLHADASLDDLDYPLIVFHRELYACSGKGPSDFLLESGAFALVTATMPYLGRSQQTALWQKIMSTSCYQHSSLQTKDWFALHAANGAGEYAESYRLALHVIRGVSAQTPKDVKEYLVASVLVSAIMTGEGRAAYDSLRTYLDDYLEKPSASLTIRLLAAQIDN